MRFPLVAAAVLLAATSALGNDTTAELGTGGLVFITTDQLKMKSEDLFVSPRQVKVTYQFENLTDKPLDVLVAFPMPDITSTGDSNIAVPFSESDNLFGFQTTFNGKPVAATLHQQAFAFNLDQSAVLAQMGLPLAPIGDRTRDMLQKLDEKSIARLLHLGLVIPMEYGDANDQWTTYYEPVWTLRSTYSWEAHFEPGETATVVHSYTPSVGGTVAVTFLAPPDEYGNRAADYKKKYCVDDALIKTLRKTLPSPEEYYAAPYYEQWITYVWSTGNNWAGPIDDFTLTIDKGDAKNLVSFCWEGEVKKIGPTTFQMKAKDWYPPWDRELDILLLDRVDNQQSAGG